MKILKFFEPHWFKALITGILFASSFIGLFLSYIGAIPLPILMIILPGANIANSISTFSGISSFNITTIIQFIYCYLISCIIYYVNNRHKLQETNIKIKTRINWRKLASKSFISLLVLILVIFVFLIIFDIFIKYLNPNNNGF